MCFIGFNELIGKQYRTFASKSNYWVYSLHSFPGQSLFPSARTFLVIVSLSLVSGKSAFLHDGYIVAIENCCAPTAVKRTLMPTRVA